MRARTATAAVLATALVGVGAALVTPTVGAEPTRPATDRNGTGNAPGARPNIVVIAVDDMAETDLRHMPITRHLMGDRGVRFTNSISPFPLCCPARVSALTGQYAHNHGVLGNGSGIYPEGGYQGFTTDGNTLATWAHAAGYQTAFVGKYLNNYGVAGYPARVPPGWDNWHGEMHPSYKAVTAYENGTTNHYPRTYRTTWTTGVATNIIRRAVPRRDPLLLLVWQYAPHNGKPVEDDDPKVVLDRGVDTPVPARSDRDSFNHMALPQDPSFNERDVSDKPDYVSRWPRLHGKGIEALEELHQQRLETLQAVDRGVERIVDSLHATGELGNTVLVFTSDNGYVLGQHRIRQGKVVPYEPGIQVPLLIRGPGFPKGAVRQQLVGTQDLGVTLARLARAEPRRVLDGVSLLRLVRRPSTMAGRDMVIEGGPKEVGGPMKFTGLRTERYTYVEYSTGERELYDLRKDPYQLRNLIGTPRLDRDLERRLVEQLRQMRHCAGNECLVETRY